VFNVVVFYFPSNTFLLYSTCEIGCIIVYEGGNEVADTTQHCCYTKEQLGKSPERKYLCK